MAALRAEFSRTAFRQCIVLWCFGYVLVDIGAALQGRSVPGVMLLTNLPLLALGIGQSLALASLMSRLHKARAVPRWLIIALAVIVAGAIQTLADFVWLRTLALSILPSWRSWAVSTNPSRLFVIYVLYTWTMALSVALIWSAKAGDVARLNEARAAIFEAQAARAQAAALRLQLNPHFLFNTLNGIASLVVRRENDAAEEMIGRLADFLRLTLAADPVALVPFRQELATIESYLEIEKARFGETMRTASDIEDEVLDAAVPNFLVQPLVENAIKHGIARAHGSGLIEIGARRDGEFLIISVANSGTSSGNDGVEPRSGPLPAGLGLANARQRLAELYGDRAWLKAGFVETGYACEIGLPMAPAALAKVAAE